MKPKPKKAKKKASPSSRSKPTKSSVYGLENEMGHVSVAEALNLSSADILLVVQLMFSDSMNATAIANACRAMYSKTATCQPTPSSCSEPTALR